MQGGEQLSGHEVLTHILEQHPRGLIPALKELRDAIRQGYQWRCITRVKFRPPITSSSILYLPMNDQQVPLDPLGSPFTAEALRPFTAEALLETNGSRMQAYHQDCPDHSVRWEASLCPQSPAKTIRFLKSMELLSNDENETGFSLQPP